MNKPGNTSFLSTLTESVTFRLPMDQKQVGETLGSTQTQLPVQVESPWASPQIPLPVERAALTLTHGLGRLQQVGGFENAPSKGRAVCF